MFLLSCFSFPVSWRPTHGCAALGWQGAQATAMHWESSHAQRSPQAALMPKGGGNITCYKGLQTLSPVCPGLTRDGEPSSWAWTSHLEHWASSGILGVRSLCIHVSCPMFWTSPEWRSGKTANDLMRHHKMLGAHSVQCSICLPS